ncbi:cysteine synthase family protein [Pseudomonas sp.]|uniref:cysteine synthase family protein n=1 Tax=Pseudomonas sp. TaxID=306 RepID=UPI003C782F23
MLDSLIGNTPIVKFKSLSIDSSIFGKLEFLNPGGSLKDRTALSLINAAESSGKLKYGMTIVESSSGNLGIALAMLCAARGYNFICVVDIKTPKATIDILSIFGSEVIIVEKGEAVGGMQAARIKIVQELVKSNPNTINLDQYNNPAAQSIHAVTAEEICNYGLSSIEYLVCSVSTGSHVSGISVKLKEAYPKLKVVAVEPVGSVVFGGKFLPFKQNGVGLSFVPGNYNRDIIDIQIKVTDDSAFKMVKYIARREGILLGPSSGGVLTAAQHIATNYKGVNIVSILPDGGAKYASQIKEITEGLGCD